MKKTPKLPWTRAEEDLLRREYPKVIDVNALAEQMGRTKESIQNKANSMGLRYGTQRHTVKTIVPTPHRPLDEIFKDQAERYKRKKERFDIKHSGIEIELSDDGPYGILFMGDPHADDDGCDLEKLSYDIHATGHPHVRAACIGDLTNNWLRALGHLYEHQGTTGDEAKELLRYLVSATDWLFIILGNHDKWSPLAQTICEERGVTHVSHGAMFKITAGKDELTIDARHTHKGNSMYNPSHAQVKRNYRGSTADIIIGGHIHSSAYTMIKNGVTGKIGHAIRVGAYKTADEYADQLGFDDECISPSVLVVVNPGAPADAYVTVFHNVDAGITYLDALRQV